MTDDCALWQIDAGYACGGVFVRDGVIVDAAPIFRKLVGQRIASVRYKKTLVDNAPAKD